MPTVPLYEDEIQAALGKDINEDSFQDLCFQFGLELDEVTSEYEMYKRERGDGFKEQEAAGKSKRVVYKVEVPANRYDLLCYEGLITALKVFKGMEPIPLIRLSGGPGDDTKMTVAASTASIRPYVVCAVLRNVSFTEASYQSFIDLQDRLHQNLCRRRTLVAIGTHDMDTLNGPFSYEALNPKDIVFKPLNQSKVVDGFGMMELYSQHQQLKAYLPIIAGSPVFPVIKDSKGVVLSLPPIINGDHSKITLNTRNVFIECTATDLTKAGVTLNTVVAMFSRYCASQFTVEPVSVEYAPDHPHAGTVVTPDLSERCMVVPTRTLTHCIDPQNPLPASFAADLLNRMGLRVAEADDDNFEVIVPVTRSDIMHACDLVEDICIGFGFDNIVPELSATLGRPREQPINQLSDLIRSEFAMAGFSESLTWGLVSLKENYENMRRPAPRLGVSGGPIRLSNPKTREFEIVRTSLLPGLLKTLAANQHLPPPLKTFEVSDVVIYDTDYEGCARNERRVAASFCGTTSGFETIHGLLDQVLWSLGCSSEIEPKSNSRRLRYKLEDSEDESLFPGRRASVVVQGEKVGVVGVIHPDVAVSFEIPFAVSVLELNLEPFLRWLQTNP